MTPEQKSKAYDEALEKAKQIIVEYDYDEHNNVFMEIFPELKESEDEKIRKEIINIFYSLADGRIPVPINFADIFTWLEKQGDNSTSIDIDEMVMKYSQTKDGDFGLPVNCMIRAYRQGINDALNLSSCIEKQGEQKSADEVEPRFHEGEWITNGDYTWKIVEVKPLVYILQSQDGNIVDDTIFHVNEQFHSFTIKDAKDGDVLYCESSGIEYIIILKQINNRSLDSYCRYNTVDGFAIDVPRVMSIQNNPKPATKEQRDTLLKAMTDAGYTFDFEKKELKKIEKESSWSEEDEYRINRISDFIWKNRKGDTDEIYQQEQDVNWLKSLRPQPKQEWSKEDKTKMRTALAFIKSEFPKEGNEEIMEDTIEWLKSLRPQQKQEWNEEDENAIKVLMNIIKKSEIIDSIIYTDSLKEKLYDWLKSLKQRIGWKPSEEQMKALAEALSLAKNCGEESAFDLRTLYEQLKKLKEE